METQTFSKEEKEEIIRYGLDRIKSTSTMTLVTLLMGCIFQVFFQSIIFLVCFIVLRKYAGGYHADTQNRCYVISTVIFAVALLAIRYMSDGNDNEIFILLQSVNFILLYFLVPVDNKNHRLEQWEKEKYGKKARIRIGCMYVLYLSLHFGAIYSIAVAVGMANVIVGGCVIAGEIKNVIFMWIVPFCKCLKMKK